LEEKRKDLERRPVRRSPDVLKLNSNSLLAWETGGICLIVLSVAVSCYVAHGMDVNERIAQAAKRRDDVLDSLTIKPVTFVSTYRAGDRNAATAVEVSIINGAHDELAQHTVQCSLYAMFNAGGGFGRGLSVHGPQTFSFIGLLGGGRGETIDCASMIGVFEPIVCADVAIHVSFTVKGQPDFPMSKDFRYSYGSVGAGLDWIQQNVNNPNDYCPGY
jgi:hypothetical protein